MVETAKTTALERRGLQKGAHEVDISKTQYRLLTCSV